MNSIKTIVVLKLITLLFLAEIMVGCYAKTTDTANQIMIKGSDSELNLLRFFSEEYKKQYPAVTFDVSGGGTTKGIDAFIKGQVDIANASRLMTEEELQEARSKGINPVAYITASDVVAIITHPEVGVDSISLSQLSRILRGVIHNWKEVGGSDMRIKIFGRDDNSGTKHFLMRTLNCYSFSDLHVNFRNNKDIIEAVSIEKGAIGYVNVGSIVNKDGKPTDKIWAMNLYSDGIIACSPYERERVKNAEYLLTRPLIQYVRKDPSEKVRNFLKFELLETQQMNLEKHGFIHINKNQVSLNQKNGLLDL